MSAPGVAGTSRKVVLAILIAGIAAGAVATYGVVRMSGPPKPLQAYALSPPVHYNTGQGYSEYTLYVTEATPEVPLAQVGFDLWRDGQFVDADANMSACAGAVLSSIASGFNLYASYKDEIGCTLSVGDWVTVRLDHGGPGHTYGVRLLQVGGGVLVNASFDAPPQPQATFGTPSTLANETVVVPLAGVTPPSPPNGFGVSTSVFCPPNGYIAAVPLKFGVLVTSPCTNVTLEDRDGDGLVSAGDAFTFANLGTASPGAYTMTLFWRDGGNVATTTFP